MPRPAARCKVLVAYGADTATKALVCLPHGERLQRPDAGRLLRDAPEVGPGPIGKDGGQQPGRNQHGRRKVGAVRQVEDGVLGKVPAALRVWAQLRVPSSNQNLGLTEPPSADLVISR